MLKATGTIQVWFLISFSVITTPLARALSLPKHVLHPQVGQTPKLILIAGSPGTGKSTFGMSVALDQGILKCVSTDTIRAVMRSYVPESISPALHRSSYAGTGEPVADWLESCKVMQDSIEGLIRDALDRKASLVLEGVSIVPDDALLEKWRASGGQAVGVLLTVPDADSHRSLLHKRGTMTGKVENDKFAQMDRIRVIQEEMIARAKACRWLMIEQRVGPDPLDLISIELDDSKTGAWEGTEAKSGKKSGSPKRKSAPKEQIHNNHQQVSTNDSKTPKKLKNIKR